MKNPFRKKEDKFYNELEEKFANELKEKIDNLNQDSYIFYDDLGFRRINNKLYGFVKYDEYSAYYFKIKKSSRLYDILDNIEFTNCIKKIRLRNEKIETLYK